MVILNTMDYEDKMETLLSDTTLYQKLDKDPTAAYKREFIKNYSQVAEYSNDHTRI